MALARPAGIALRHRPNPAAERLLAALRTRAPAKPDTQTGPDLVTPTIEDR
jgi:hypothetical protein